MPKAAVDEDHFPMARKDDVGPAGQAGRVESKSKAHSMQSAPYTEFEARVLAVNLAHYLRALRRGIDISHGYSLPGFLDLFRRRALVGG
jgi:hypothetical protein